MIARSTIVRLSSATLALAALSGTASAAVFFDGVFNGSDWGLSVTTNISGAGSSAAGFQVLAGGNPNEYRRIRHQLVVSSAGNGAVIGVHLNALSFYTPSSQGAISSINYSEDSIAFAGPGNVQGSGLAIVQNGRTYVQRVPIFVMPLPTFSIWTSQSTSLSAADLHELDNSGNFLPFNNPDFSATGSIMQFGFWRGNSANQSVNTDAGIDNWRVEVIPTPAAASMLLGAGVLASRRRRA
jgi:hypothetical protein